MTKEKIVDRVRRLLALAGNNPSAEEAQSAMLHAQRLMVQHAISEADLEDSEDQEVVDVPVDFGVLRRNRFHSMLLDIVCRNFRCVACSSILGNGIVMGLPADAAAASAVYQMAKASLTSSRQAYLKKRRRLEPNMTPRRAADLRNQWSFGFCRGLKAAFEDQVESCGYAMVLVTPALVVKAAENIEEADDFKEPKTGKYDPDAVRDGIEKGERFAEVSRSAPQVDTPLLSESDD